MCILYQVRKPVNDMKDCDVDICYNIDCDKGFYNECLAFCLTTIEGINIDVNVHEDEMIENCVKTAAIGETIISMDEEIYRIDQGYTKSAR